MTILEERLQIHGFRVDDVAVVVARGDIDEAGAQSLRAMFDSLRADDHVYVDCEGVGFIGESGMSVLQALATRNVAAGGPLHVSASAEVRRRIEIDGLEHLFAID